MPYIPAKDRPKYDVVIAQVPTLQSVGDLNYVLTEICARYLLDRGLRYEYQEDITGVLNHIDGEFKRRLLYPYEDKKIREHGDTAGFRELLKKL